MNWLQYWPLLEITLILVVFAFVIVTLLRAARRRAQTPTPYPATLSGRIRFGVSYLARLLGVAAGTLLLIALVVMIGRNLFSVITETAPAPSKVIVPPNLGFAVEQVTFESGDDLTMAGWFVPGQNGVTIILLHGYRGQLDAGLDL